MMDTFDAIQLAELANRFEIDGEVARVVPFGSGHINDTYRVDTHKDGGNAYLLQRVNRHVFKDVAALMQNMELVTRHLKEKYRALGEIDPENRVLTLIPDHTGKPYLQDETGN